MQWWPEEVHVAVSNGTVWSSGVRREPQSFSCMSGRPRHGEAAVSPASVPKGTGATRGCRASVVGPDVVQGCGRRGGDIDGPAAEVARPCRLQDVPMETP